MLYNLLIFLLRVNTNESCQNHCSLFTFFFNNTHFTILCLESNGPIIKGTLFFFIKCKVRPSIQEFFVVIHFR